MDYNTFGKSYRAAFNHSIMTSIYRKSFSTAAELLIEIERAKIHFGNIVCAIRTREYILSLSIYLI